MGTIRVTMPAILMAAVAVSLFTGTAAAADDIIATAGQGHLWFIKDSEVTPGEFLLCHLADDSKTLYYRPQVELPQSPQALASWENRVWMVMPPKPAQPQNQREVFTISVHKTPALGIYTSSPAGRLDIVAPLPGDGELISFIGTGEGPIALVDSNQPAASTKLWKLSKGQWSEIDISELLPGVTPVALATWGSGGRQLAILAVDNIDPQRGVRYDLERDGQWTSSGVILNIQRVHSLATASGQIAALLADQSQGELEIVYLRPGRILPLASLPRPSGNWSLVSMNVAPLLLQLSRAGEWNLTLIDPVSGEANEVKELKLQPLTAGKFWQMSLIVAFVAGAILLAMVIRPVPASKVVLPEKSTVLAVVPRLAALGTDLFPAGIVALLITRSPVNDLLAMPVMTFDLERSTPYLVMVALTIVHSAIGEMFRGCTLGKALVGARISTSDGSPLKRSRVVIRNLVKAVVLVIPPLAVIAVLNAHLQGLPDIVSRTVVIHEPDDESDSGPSKGSDDR